MTRVSTSEEGRAAGLGASSFNRAACAGACAGYEPCFVRMGPGYGEGSAWSTMSAEAGRAHLDTATSRRLDLPLLLWRRGPGRGGRHTGKPLLYSSAPPFVPLSPTLSPLPRAH